MVLNIILNDVPVYLISCSCGRARGGAWEDLEMGTEWPWDLGRAGKMGSHWELHGQGVKCPAWNTQGQCQLLEPAPRCACRECHPLLQPCSPRVMPNHPKMRNCRAMGLKSSHPPPLTAFPALSSFSPVPPAEQTHPGAISLPAGPPEPSTDPSSAGQAAALG